MEIGKATEEFLIAFTEDWWGDIQRDLGVIKVAVMAASGGLLVEAPISNVLEHLDGAIEMLSELSETGEIDFKKIDGPTQSIH